MQPLSDADLSTILKADLLEAYKALRDHEAALEPSKCLPQTVAPEVLTVHLGEHDGEQVEAHRVAPYASAWQVRAGLLVLNHRGAWEVEPDRNADPVKRAAFTARTRRTTLGACREALRSAGPMPGAL